MDSVRSKLIAFYRERKRMPSYAEALPLLGYKSKGGLAKLIGKLTEQGFLMKDDSSRLLPSAAFQEVPLLGLVEAGFPSPAEEDAETVSLDDYLITNRAANYVLRVKGDSMTDAGIREGDLVVVEKGRTPKPGDIVIARIDGEYTMKYYRRRGGRPYLEAANRRYKPIFPTGELEIAAVVRGVVRKY